MQHPMGERREKENGKGHVQGPTTEAQVEWVATVGQNSLGAFPQDMEIAIRGDLPKNLWKHPWEKKIF